MAVSYRRHHLHGGLFWLLTSCEGGYFSWPQMDTALGHWWILYLGHGQSASGTPGLRRFDPWWRRLIAPMKWWPSRATGRKRSTTTRGSGAIRRSATSTGFGSKTRGREARRIVESRSCAERGDGTSPYGLQRGDMKT